MRNLKNNYDIIFSDIDDTLIYGIWTDIMAATWSIFHCNFLSDILMTLQDVFNLFKVNHKLVYMIKTSSLPVIFLTARKYCPATENIIKKILGEDYLGGVVSLQTDNPHLDKIDYIHNMAIEEGLRACIFDDNEYVRKAASLDGIDAFNPTAMFEKVIQ